MNDEDLKLIEMAEGCMTTAERFALAELAEKLEKGVIVEIGSFRGSSTIALALGSQAGSGAEVYSIDPHELVEDSTCEGTFYGEHDRQKWTWTVSRAGCAEIVRPIFLKASKSLAHAIDKEVGILFVDGDHKHPAPLNDVKAFYEYVLPEGVIVLDDCDQKGPAKACQWLEMMDWEVTDSNSKLAVLRRK